MSTLSMSLQRAFLNALGMPVLGAQPNGGQNGGCSSLTYSATSITEWANPLPRLERQFCGYLDLPGSGPSVLIYVCDEADGEGMGLLFLHHTRRGKTRPMGRTTLLLSRPSLDPRHVGPGSSLSSPAACLVLVVGAPLPLPRRCSSPLHSPHLALHIVSKVCVVWHCGVC